MPLDSAKLLKSVDDFQIHVVGECDHPDVVVAA